MLALVDALKISFFLKSQSYLNTVRFRTSLLLAILFSFLIAFAFFVNLFLINYSSANSGSLTFIGVETNPVSNFYYVFFMLLPTLFTNLLGTFIILFVCFILAIIVKIVLFKYKVSFLNSFKIALLNSPIPCLVIIFIPDFFIILLSVFLTLTIRLVLYFNSFKPVTK